MWHIRRDHATLAGTKYPCFTIQSEFKLTRDHVNRLFMNM